VRNEETVQDLALTFSVRKDFDWYGVLSKKDNITFTPVIMLTCGTQNFGFNTSYAYNFPVIRKNSLPSNQQLSESTAFTAQSASMVLRGSYLRGKVLVQPQVLFDYYLPAGDDKFNVAFSIMAGISL